MRVFDLINLISKDQHIPLSAIKLIMKNEESKGVDDGNFKTMNEMVGNVVINT